MPKFDLGDTIFVVLLLIALFAGGGGEATPSPSVKVTAITYVYEKDQNPVPSPVLVALNTLNRAGLAATDFEQNTVNGKGETPEQYKVPLAAAKAAGLPALVVTSGTTVIRTVKAPTTAEAVLEAAKP